MGTLNDAPMSGRIAGAETSVVVGVAIPQDSNVRPFHNLISWEQKAPVMVDGNAHAGRLSNDGKPSQELSAMAQVYIVQAGRFFKIGITSGSIEGRIRALQTGCPHKINLVVSVPVGPHARAMEAQFHELLSEYRQVGEWFDISPAVVVRAMMILAFAVGDLGLEPSDVTFGHEDDWFISWTQAFIDLLDGRRPARPEEEP